MKDIFLLLWRTAPIPVGANVGLMVVNALMPLAVFWTIGRLVDETISLFGAGGCAVSLWALAPWLCLFGALLFLSYAFGILAGYCSSVLAERVRSAVSQVIHYKMSLLSYQTLQTPRFQNEAFRAVAGSADRPARVLESTLGLAQSALTFVSLGLWLGGVRWWLPLLVLLAGVPIGLARLRTTRESFDLYKKQSEGERRLAYYNRVLTSHHALPEQSIFGFGPFFRKLYVDLLHRQARNRLDVQRGAVSRQIVAFALSSVILVAVFVVIILLVAQGGLSVGALAMYLMAVRRVDTAVRDVAARGVALHNQSLYVHCLAEFLSSTDFHTGSLAFPADFKYIEFQNVSFAYPESEREVFSGLSFRIGRGEVVGIAGSNGCGKSTVVKLLCGLLRPCDGVVMVGGVPVSDIRPRGLVGHVAAVFQDFNLYNVTAGENIWFGNMAEPFNLERVREKASRAGLDTLISSLTAGYDTRLGNTFQGSEMFSRGEWQRMALARVLYSNAEIIILDEPTSALDPGARRAVLECVEDLRRQGRTVIIVSHIDETLAAADRVIRLEEVGYERRKE